MNEGEKIYSTKEVARMCGVSRYRIMLAIHNREIDFLNFAQPGAKKAKMYRFTASAVDRWLHSIRNYAFDSSSGRESGERREPDKQMIL